MRLLARSPFSQWHEIRSFELEKMMLARGITSTLDVEEEEWADMVRQAEGVADALVPSRGALVEPEERGSGGGHLAGLAPRVDRREAP